MNLTLFAFTFLAGSSAEFAVSPNSALRDSDPILASRIDAMLTAPVAQRTFSGAVLIAKNGKPAFRKAYGIAEPMGKTPNSPSDGFMLFSVTKQFTAALILHLERTKKLNVSDPVAKHLQNWPEEWKGVTLHHLLTHSSGIDVDMLYFWLVKEYPTFWEDSSQKPPPYKPTKLLDGPGKTFRYSNAGYTVLSLIAEKVSSKPFSELMQQGILTKAGMSHSGLESLTNKVSRVRGMRLQGDKLQIVEQKTVDIRGAGDLVSTIDDMLNWDNSLRENKVLSEESVRKMFAPQFQGKQAALGYGWRIEQTKNNQRRFLFGGSGTGFSSFVARRPDLDLYFVCLCNLDAESLSPNPRKILELAESHFESKRD